MAAAGRSTTRLARCTPARRGRGRGDGSNALGRGLYEDLIARSTLRLTPEEQQRRRKLQDRLSALDATLTRLEEEPATPKRRERIEQVDRERTTAQREWSELEAELRRRSPTPPADGYDLGIQKHLARRPPWSLGSI
jgi:hypothetical protein